MRLRKARTRKRLWRILTPGIGSSIVTEAKKRYDKKRQDAVINAVQQVIQWRDEAQLSLTQQTTQLNARIEWFGKVIEALNKGSFDFDGASIRFHDKELSLNPAPEFWGRQ